MVPEAGGSSSFARRAFNEFVSFGAGWALMLDYIVTDRHLAYFVPNYLAVFWPALKTCPVQLHRRHRHDHLPGRRSTSSASRRRRGSTSSSRSLDLGTQVLLMVIGVVLLLAPQMLIDQVHLGVAPTWAQFIYGISIGTIAYTGIETVSNMAEEAANPDRDVPRAINFVLVAVLVVYIGISHGGPVRDAGQAATCCASTPRPGDGAGPGRGQGQGRAERPVRASRGRHRPATPATWSTSRLETGQRHVAHPGPEAGPTEPFTQGGQSTPGCTARCWAATTSRIPSWASCASCRPIWTGSRRILMPWVGILAATILSSPRTRARSACRGSPIRWASTDRCRRSSAASIPSG